MSKTPMHDELNNVLKWLRAYEITNAEVLDASDLHDVRKAIILVSILQTFADILGALTDHY